MPAVTELACVAELPAQRGFRVLVTCTPEIESSVAGFEPLDAIGPYEILAHIPG
jgi:hypothetical protein